MRRPGRHSGHVLLGTMTFLILAMLVWLAAFSAMSANVRTAKIFLLRQDLEHGAYRALAWGLALLETGNPPENPYSCRAAVDTDLTYVITFNLASPTEASVFVRAATAGDTSLPWAPEEF